MASKTLVIEFLGKDNVSQVTGGITKSLGGLGKMAAGIAVGGLVAATTVSVGLGKVLTNLGSDAEEMLGKFNVVFGDMAETVSKELDKFGKSVGRSKYDLMDMASTVQDTFVPMGFARDQAADLSVELTKLATDVASFNNAPDTDVMRDFQSAIVGNHETVRKYGIVITQAALEQELFNMGIEDGLDAASEAQKVQARLNLIYAGTTDAQGDAARTSESWANQMRRLKSIIKDTATEMGLKLLPAITPLLIKLGDFATAIAPQVIAGFEKFVNVLMERVLPAVTQFMQGFLIPFAQQVGMLITTMLPGLGKAFGSLGGFIQQVLTSIQNFAAQAIPALLLFARNTAIPLIQQVINVLGTFVNFIMTQVIPTIINFIQNTALPLFREFITFIKTQVIPALLLFIQETLLPMANRFIEFIEELLPKLWLAFSNIITFIREEAAPAIADFVETKIIPMIQAIREWITELVERAAPIVAEFKEKLSAVLGPAMLMIQDAGRNLAEAFSGLGIKIGGTGEKVDAIQVILWAFKGVLDAIVVAVQLVATVILALSKAILAVRNAINWVIDRFKEFKETMQEAADAIPPWLRPGSPTPFELGLRGIGSAMRDLNTQFGGITVGAGGGGLAGAGIGGGMGPIVVNLTYSPAVSLGDRYEAENRLAPYIAGAVRRELEFRGVI